MLKSVKKGYSPVPAVVIIFGRPHHKLISVVTIIIIKAF